MPLGSTIGELGYKLEGEVRRYFRAGDVYPPLCATLKRSDFTPVDFSSVATMVVASVAFSMRDYSNPYAIPKVNNQACIITNATFGQVCYHWQANDLSTVGIYEGQFKLYYNATVADGSTTGHQITEVFPTNITLLVFVSESIS